MGQVNLGRVVGKSVYIKYNTLPQDEGATSIWQEGQNYIGTVTSNADIAPETGYTWAMFIDESVRADLDALQDTVATKASTIAMNNALATKAPINHASDGTTHGAASATQYGHYKYGTDPNFAKQTDLNTLSTAIATKANKTDLDTLNTTVAGKANKTGIDTTSIDISASSGTQYYLGRTVSGTISGDARVILTNCAGAITMSGNNAKVRVSNCPYLTIMGINYQNRKNLTYPSNARTFRFVGSTGVVFEWNYSTDPWGHVIATLQDGAGKLYFRRKDNGGTLASIKPASTAIILMGNRMEFFLLGGPVTEDAIKSEWGQYTGGFELYLEGSNLTGQITVLSTEGVY